MTLTKEQRSWQILEETRKSNADNTVIKTLLAQGDVDFNIGVNAHRDSMLIFSIWHQNTEAVRLLVNAGAPVNAQITRAKPSPPLFWAIANQDLLTTKVLIHAGADINQQDAHKNTALMHAIKNKDTDIVRFLLISGASLKTKNILDETPMILAEKTEKKKIIHLIKTFNNPNSREKAIKNYFNQQLSSKKDLPRKKAVFKNKPFK